MKPLLGIHIQRVDRGRPLLDRVTVEGADGYLPVTTWSVHRDMDNGELVTITIPGRYVSFGDGPLPEDGHE